MVWTTPERSDTCTAYGAQQAPPQVTFDTKQECVDWVAQRGCRPGNCFDGCNWSSCDYEGKSAKTTMKGCGVGVGTMVRFVPGSVELEQVPDWDELLERIEMIFRVEERVLHVVGHASMAEAPSYAEGRLLALRRAEAIKSALVTRGVPAQRLITEASDPQLGKLDRELPLVSFRAVPDQPRRNDLRRDSREYRDYCGK